MATGRDERVIRVAVCPEHGPREVLKAGAKPIRCTYYVTNAQCRREQDVVTYAPGDGAERERG